MEQAQRGLGETRRQGSTLQRAVLVVGDVVAFIVFAWIGRRSHAESVGLDGLVETVETAAPFIAGWFLVSPLLGAFRAEMAPGVMARRTALAWLPALPVALVLRALALGRASPAIFAVITGVTNLVLLVGWRTAFAWVLRRRVVG